MLSGWSVSTCALLCQLALGCQTATVRPNGITDRKIIFELIMHFMADTDTDENYLECFFGSRYRDSCSLQPGGGGIADQNCFGHNFHFIADTDTEKYYFRIISAMISDKR